MFLNHCTPSSQVAKTNRCSVVLPTVRVTPLASVLAARRGRYGGVMAASVKKLDVHVGDVVEIGARRYDVVLDPSSGIALEPVIAEIQGNPGLRPLSASEFDAQFGDLPVDGEG